MDTEVVMSLVAGCAALAGVLASVASLTEKQRAEREFLTVLATGTAAAGLRKLRSKIMEDGAVSSSELQKLIGSLEMLTNQPRYAAKLMNRAGTGSGSLPIATP